MTTNTDGYRVAPDGATLMEKGDGDWVIRVWVEEA